MLQNIFIKPLELDIGDKVITFKSMDDFEFAMSARAMLPQERITGAINATSGELDLELNSIIVAIEHVTELTNPPSKTNDITQKLKAINPVIFSNDNNWRDIFISLKKDHSTESSKYKFIALTAYLQYLTNRQEMVQSIKTRLEKDSIQKEHAETAEFNTGELDIDNNFDVKVLAKELGMKKIPTGEFVVFELEEGEEIALLLANHQCRLILEDGGVKFVNKENNVYPMTIGLNKIGRGRESNVRIIDATQRISRVHLVIINHDNKKLELTDQSTYGTYFLKKPS